MPSILTRLKARPFLDYLLIVLVALFFFRGALFNNGYQMGADALSWYAFQRYLALTGSYYATWEGVSSPGTMGQIIPFNAIMTFLLTLSSSPISVKFLFFLMQIVAGLGTYFLAVRWFKNRNIALVAGVLYMTNRTYLDDVLMGHYYIVFGQALIPVVLLAWDNMVHKGTLISIVLASMVFSVFLSSAHLSFLYAFAPFLGAFIVFDTLWAKAQAKGITLWRFLRPLLAFFPICAALSMAYILPAVLARAMTSRVAFRPYELLVRTVLNNSPQSIWESITLGKVEGSFIVPDAAVSASLSLLPILAFGALLFRRDRYTVFLAAISVPLVFLGKGVYPPFGGAYWWLMGNFPQFANMRIPSRWMFPAVFCYSMLAGVTVVALAEYVRAAGPGLIRRLPTWGRRLWPHNGTLSLGLSAVLLLGMITPQWQMLKFGVKSFDIPPDYRDTYRWIEEQPGDFIALFLPFRGGSGSVNPVGIQTTTGWYSTWQWGNWSGAIHGKTVMGREEWYPPSMYYLEYLTTHVRDIPTPQVLKLLGQFNVRYLVDLPHAPEEERRFFGSILGLSEVYRNTSAVVYENPYWRPHVFASSRYIATVGGAEAFSSSLAFLSEPGMALTPQLFAFRNESNLDRIVGGSDAVLFADGDFWDLVFTSLRAHGKGYVLDAAGYMKKESADPSGWIQDNTYSLEGRSIASLSWTDVYTTGLEATLDVPVTLQTPGEYEVWVRVHFGGGKGELSVAVGDFEGSVRPNEGRPYNTFRWVKLGQASLSEGEQTLKITHRRVNVAEAEGNVVDQIAIVAPSDLTGEMEVVKQAVKDKPLAFLIQQNRVKTEGLARDPDASDGQIVRSVLPTSMSVYLPAPGEFQLGLRATNVRATGTLAVRVNGEDVGLMPLAGDLTEAPGGSGVAPYQIIEDDSQASTWKSSNPPEQVSLVDDAADKRSGADSLRIDILKADRSFFTLAQKTFSQPMDWSDKRFLSLYLKGTGSPSRLFIQARSGAEAAATWYLPDIREWNRLLLPLDSPDSGGEQMDWTKVTEIRFGFDSKAITGSIHIDAIAVWDKETVESGKEPFKWYYFDSPIALDEGENEIVLEPMGPLWLDMVSVQSAGIGDGEDALRKLLFYDPQEVGISHQKVEPTLYQVELAAEKPVVLGFTEGYHPLWKAYVNGQELDPVMANGFFDGYFIDEPGQHSIRLEFKAQRYASWGARLSLVAWAVAGGYLAFIGLRKWRRHSRKRSPDA